MSDKDGVIVQINFKNSAGTMLNLYARSEDELTTALMIAGNNLADMVALESQFAAASTVAAAMPVKGSQTAGWGSAPPHPQPASNQSVGQATVTVAQPGTSPVCKHGPRTARSGSGAKGPWRAWMCPEPKGSSDQCQPEWLRQGTPGWDSFPA